MGRRSAAAGFTIIELMVVVAIAGVLSLAALPAMRDMITSNRMKAVSLDLYTSLALARSEAIKRSASNVSMVAASGGWQNGWTVCVDGATTPPTPNGSCGDAQDIVLITGDAPDSSLTLTGPAGNIVTYNRDGRLATTAPAFKIKAGTNNAKAPMRCVDVSASGRPATRADSNGVDSDGCN